MSPATRPRISARPPGRTPDLRGEFVVGKFQRARSRHDHEPAASAERGAQLLERPANPAPHEISFDRAADRFPDGDRDPARAAAGRKDGDRGEVLLAPGPAHERDLARSP